jgi:hypothetical protein
MKAFYHTIAVITFNLSHWANSLAHWLAVVCKWATNNDIEKDLERQRKRWS